MTGLGPIPSPGDIPAPFLNALRYIAACYPHWSLTEGTGVAYYDVLRDLDPAILSDAVRTYAREGHEFAPSAGTLRQMALAIRRARRPHPEECDCIECINALPVAERWMRMSPNMRRALQLDQPELARKLAEAVPAKVRERVEGVRRMLSFPKAP